MKKEIELPETVEEIMAHFGGRLDGYSPAMMKYIHSEVLKQFLYITPGTKKRMAYCTHCGKDMDLAEYWPDEYYHWKHNGQVMCPHCGHVVTVKTRRGAENQAVYFPWWEKSQMDKDILVCRGIYVQRGVSQDTMRNPDITIRVDNAIVFIYGKGVAMVEPKRGITVDSWNYEYALENGRVPGYTMVDRVHDRSSAYKQRCQICSGWSSLLEAVRGTPFRWADVRKFPYDEYDTVKALTMFSRYRAWEWLCKMGLTSILQAYTAGKDPRAGKCFNWRGKTVDAIFRGHLTKEDKRRMLQGVIEDAGTISNWQKWKSHFPKLTLSGFLDLESMFEASWRYRSDMDDILFCHVDPDKFRRWIEKKRRAGAYEYVSFGDYLDYLHQLAILHYDLDDKDNLFPRHFQEFHRQLSAQIDMMRREKADPVESSRWAKRRMVLTRKYTYQDEEKNLMVVVPEKISDLRDEGRNQRNCVGNYMDRVANGATDVVFIRRIDRPKDSYITVEIDPHNGDIIQARQIYNQSIHDDEDLDFLKGFEAHIQDVMESEKTAGRKTA